MTSPAVIIVGGGIAGLAAAYELHQRRVPFLLLEAGPRAGGVVLSEEVDGFTIDAGPDALLVQKPEGIKLCEEIGLGDRLISTTPPRLAYIQRGGRLHPLPASSVLGMPTEWRPFMETRLFSPVGKLRMAVELFVPPRRDEEDESIGSFITRRFGHEAAAYLAEPLLAGIHAGDVNRLSTHALFPRLVEAERTYGSLLRAFRAPQRDPSSQFTANPSGPAPDSPRRSDRHGGAFRSLPGGLSEMVRALVARLAADSMRLRTAVSRVSLSGTGVVVETAGGERIAAHAVILATPAYASARILRDVDAALAGRCGQIPYASTAVVALAFRRDQVRHPLEGSGFVVPRVEKTGILAGTWLSSKWAHRAPEGRVLLRTFIGGSRDPQALECSDQELIQRSLSALQPLLGITGNPLLTRIYRWNGASAQYEVGHLDRIAAIERALARHPGLFLTGSGFRGVGIPDCVADARATARQVSTWIPQKLST